MVVVNIIVKILALALTNLTFFNLSHGLRVENSLFWQSQLWKSQKPWLGSKYVRSMTPPKVRFLMPNKVLESKKRYRGPQKMKKTVFLKNAMASK